MGVNHSKKIMKLFKVVDVMIILYVDLLIYTCTCKAPPMAVNKCVIHTDENVLTCLTQTDIQIPYDVSVCLSV